MENEPKGQDVEFKEPHFHWTRDLIAEFARYVAESYKESEIWTSDLTAEKQMLDNFIKAKKFEQLHRELIVSEAGQTLIVYKEKLEEIIKFLYNYKDQEN
jgi:hypothetical protein